MRVITVYKDAFSKEQFFSTPEEMMKDILSGTFKDVIEYLRSLSKEEYSKEKLTIPACTWSGKFNERKDNAILEYSNLLVIDIDKIEESAINELKEKMCVDKYIRYVFTSPSNKGIKVIVEVSSGSEHHKVAFSQVKKYIEDKYKIEVDPSGKNISRLCFVSYDPLAIIKDSEVFNVDTSIKESFSMIKENVSSTVINYDTSKIFDRCVEWVNKGGSYSEGSRNIYIHALSCAMNRCGVDIEECTSLILSNYTDLEDREIRTTVRSAYFHNQSEHGTTKLVDIGKSDIKSSKYIHNYTDDVVSNDLMRITSMLYDKKIDKVDIYDIVGKVAKYYKIEGYIDLDRHSLSELMNKSVQILKSRILEDSDKLSLKYESAEDMVLKLVDNDILDDVIPTFIADMDMAMRGGMMPGNFYGLIGVGGTYKSIVSEYWACRNAMNGTAVLYLNGEMSDMQFYERLSLMALKKNFYFDMHNGMLNKTNAQDRVEEMKVLMNNNLFVVNGNGFNEINIKNTIENIEVKTGKKIKLVVIDGVTQMDPCGKEEIPAAIMNTQKCKEIAKENNCVIVGLMHISGDNNKTLRDTGLKCRGGNKTTANMDGYFSTSLLIDPITNELESDDDIQYIQGMLYFRLTDKRTPAGVVSKIVQLDQYINLEALEDDPRTYEIRINKTKKNEKSIF